MPGSQKLASLVVLAIFGIGVPWLKGLDFLDPVIIAAYCCLGVLFAGPAAARAISLERPAAAGPALRVIWKRAALGEALAIAMLAIGIATVNVSVSLTRGSASLHLPELDSIAEAVVLGIAGTLAFAALAAWITLRFSALTAKRAMRVIFMLLAFALLYWPRRLPEVALEGAGLCAIVAALMIFLVVRFPFAARAAGAAADTKSAAPESEKSKA